MQIGIDLKFLVASKSIKKALITIEWKEFLSTLLKSIVTQYPDTLWHRDRKITDAIKHQK